MLGAFFLPVTLLFAIYTLTIDSGFAGHLCLVSWGGLGLLSIKKEKKVEFLLNSGATYSVLTTRKSPLS